MTGLTDAEILDALDASLARWRTRHDFHMRYDMQFGELVITTSRHDPRSARECLQDAIQTYLVDRVTDKLQGK